MFFHQIFHITWLYKHHQTSNHIKLCYGDSPSPPLFNFTSKFTFQSLQCLFLHAPCVPYPANVVRCIQISWSIHPEYKRTLKARPDSNIRNNQCLCYRILPPCLIHPQRRDQTLTPPHIPFYLTMATQHNMFVEYRKQQKKYKRYMTSLGSSSSSSSCKFPFCFWLKTWMVSGRELGHHTDTATHAPTHPHA